MADVDAVFFDLDLTLVYMNVEVRDRLVAGICRDLAGRHGLDADALVALQGAVTLPRWREFQDTLLAAPERAPDGQTIMRSIRSDALTGSGCDDPEVVEEAFAAYWDNRDGIFAAYEEVEDVLQTLSARMPLAVITNGPSITQLDKLSILGLDRYVSIFLASGDVGCEKPDRRIFDLTLQKLGVRSERAWHVGDNPLVDVGGAIGAGIRAAWVNREGREPHPDHPKPHAEVADLRELLPLLGL
jgi:HAD superfamily hydrolase (TIGR01549 family)